jgi:hypothetical protein
MNLKELKIRLMALIGSCIDEESMPEMHASFVEMDSRVIHVVQKSTSRYLKVTLTEVDKNQYFNTYDPDDDQI